MNPSSGPLPDSGSAAGSVTLSEVELCEQTVPYLRIGNLPTPLQPLPRLSEHLGQEIWVKRDDLTGLAFGGNKVRKLEFLMAEASHRDADTVLTVGSAQSNHCRQTAAAAPLVGMECHLILGGDPPERRTGNLLLDDLLDAQIHFEGTEDWDRLEYIMRDRMKDLRDRGKTPYPIPLGGSNATGILGFVTAYREIRSQCVEADIQPSALVITSSSGGTQAGLELGKQLFDESETGFVPDVVGIAAAKSDRELRTTITELIEEGTQKLDLNSSFSSGELELHDEYIGPAYGTPTAESKAALRLVARKESLLLDPVYTSKAMAGMIDLVKDGHFGTGPLVFWHTGGTPALFAEAYETMWS